MLDPTAVADSLRDAVREVLTRHDINPTNRPVNCLFDALRKDALSDVIPIEQKALSGDIHTTIMRALNRRDDMTLSQFITPCLDILFGIKL